MNERELTLTEILHEKLENKSTVFNSGELTKLMKKDELLDIKKIQEDKTQLKNDKMALREEIAKEKERQKEISLEIKRLREENKNILESQKKLRNLQLLENLKDHTAKLIAELNCLKDDNCAEFSLASKEIVNFRNRELDKVEKFCDSIDKKKEAKQKQIDTLILELENYANEMEIEVQKRTDEIDILCEEKSKKIQPKPIDENRIAKVEKMITSNFEKQSKLEKLI